MKTLRVRSADTAQLILDLEWSGGLITVNHVVRGMEPAIQQWITDGVRDFVSVDGEVLPSHTRPEDPRFLEALESYVRRQSGWLTSIHQRDSVFIFVRRVATTTSTSVTPLADAADSSGSTIAAVITSDGWNRWQLGDDAQAAVTMPPPLTVSASDSAGGVLHA